MTTRLQLIEGTYNFRDLGGFRAAGGTTRHGVFYRSDALHRLSPRSHEQLTGLGITRVIDLRDNTERGRLPDSLPEGSALLPHPIFEDARAHISAELDVVVLTEIIYRTHGRNVARAVSMLAAEIPADDAPAESASTGATVFHCTAGKDRTGAVAAIALLAVGVDRDEVVDDYAESERHLTGEWLDAQLDVLRGQGIAVTPVVEELIGGSPARAIEAALVGIERDYGSARDYLIAHGAEAAALERLETRLVSTV